MLEGWEFLIKDGRLESAIDANSVTVELCSENIDLTESHMAYFSFTEKKTKLTVLYNVRTGDVAPRKKIEEALADPKISEIVAMAVILESLGLDSCHPMEVLKSIISGEKINLPHLDTADLLLRRLDFGAAIKKIKAVDLARKGQHDI